ncbi:MAG TPA: hypothetical protein VF476_10465, partial [Chitinophagaceae bacterium]
LMSVLLRLMLEINTANFSKGTLRLLDTAEVYQLIKPYRGITEVTRLQKAGVSFWTAVKTTGTATDEVLMVVYDGQVIASGTAKEVKETIKDIFKLTGSKLISALDTFITEIGVYSKRAFHPNKAGGPILDLDWRTAKITRQGIATIKKHLSRFEFDSWNERMLQRLEKISNGEMQVTDFDKRFFTHEIREFERYKALGYENTSQSKISDFENVWNDAHTASLEDYKLYEKMIYEEKEIRTLYHPSVQY